jgi:hypothetical protein
MFADIFSRPRLTPGQLRAVAERRFGDAKCLVDSGNSERANGAIYMAGFVIECLLKALLLERRPNLQRRVDPARLSAGDEKVLNLLYRHDLDEMLVYLPEVERKLEGVRTKSRQPAWREFNSICAQWTIYARYSSRSAKIADARNYLETIGEAKKWLKEL